MAARTSVMRVGGWVRGIAVALGSGELERFAELEVRPTEAVPTWRGLERERARGGARVEMSAVVAGKPERELLGFYSQLRVDEGSHAFSARTAKRAFTGKAALVVRARSRS